MQWPAPVTGIAMCQIAVAIEEQRESAYGYTWLSRGGLRDGEFGAVSRPPGHDVGFSTDFVGSAPESRRGTGSRFSSARDPGCSLTRGLNVKLSVMRLPGSLFSPQ